VQAREEEEEFRRAQERLTLKHRNTTRWARRALKRGLHLATTGEQDALHEQLRLGRELRAKAADMDGAKGTDDRCAGLSLAAVVRSLHGCAGHSGMDRI
jgi:U3 small nucleolar RNA-associated protein 14